MTIQNENRKVYSNEDLNQVCKEVGSENGYRGRGIFATSEDLKVTYERTETDISFKVPDYLRGASNKVISDLLTSIFFHIRGDHERARGYLTEDVRSYLGSDVFVARNRETYLRRHKKYLVEGEDTDEYLQILEIMGLITKAEADSLAIRWWWLPSNRPWNVSVPMKVVELNSDLDDFEVPQNVILWVLYQAICQVSAGINWDGSGLKTSLRLKHFPSEDREEAEKWLKAHKYCGISNLC